MPYSLLCGCERISSLLSGLEAAVERRVVFQICTLVLPPFITWSV
jgi:hypothetical protein